MVSRLYLFIHEKVDDVIQSVDSKIVIIEKSTNSKKRLFDFYFSWLPDELTVGLTFCINADGLMPNCLWKSLEKLLGVV